jgi:hypothetical protein
MHVRAQSGSGSNSTVVNPAIKDLQAALAQAEYQKSRADELAKELSDWKTQASTWENLFIDERKRSDLLTSALADRKDAEGSRGLAVTLLQQQVTDDGQMIKEVNQELKTCEQSKLKWAVVGAGIGAGFGYAAHK